MSTTLTTLTAAADVLAVVDPGSAVPPGGDKLQLVASWAKWVAGIALFIGVCFVAAQMAVNHRRGSGGEHGAALGYVGGGAILVSVGAGLLTALGA